MEDGRKSGNPRGSGPSFNISSFLVVSAPGSPPHVCIHPHHTPHQFSSSLYEIYLHLEIRILGALPHVGCLNLLRSPHGYLVRAPPRAARIFGQDSGPPWPFIPYATFPHFHQFQLSLSHSITPSFPPSYGEGHYHLNFLSSPSVGSAVAIRSELRKNIVRTSGWYLELGNSRYRSTFTVALVLLLQQVLCSQELHEHNPMENDLHVSPHPRKPIGINSIPSSPLDDQASHPKRPKTPVHRNLWTRTPKTEQQPAREEAMIHSCINKTSPLLHEQHFFTGETGSSRHTAAAAAKKCQLP